MFTLFNDNSDEFSKLCNDTYNELHSFAVRLEHGDRYRAEDIVQNTFIIALKKRDYLVQLSHNDQVGWLFNTLINSHKNVKKKTGRLIQKEVELNEDAAGDKYQTMDNFESLELIDEITSILSVKETELFTDYYVDGYSLHEISDKRGIEYNTVKVYCSRIAKKLKPYFGK